MSEHLTNATLRDWTIPNSVYEAIKTMIASSNRNLIQRARAYYTCMSLIDDLYAALKLTGDLDYHIRSVNGWFFLPSMLIHNRYGRRAETTRLIYEMEKSNIVKTMVDVRQVLRLQIVNQSDSFVTVRSERGTSLFWEYVNRYHVSVTMKRMLKRTHTRQPDRYASLLDFDSIDSKEIMKEKFIKLYKRLTEKVHERETFIEFKETDTEVWKNNTPMTREKSGGRYFSPWCVVQHDFRKRVYDVRTGKRLVEIDICCAQFSFLADWIDYISKSLNVNRRANQHLITKMLASNEIADFRKFVNRDLYRAITNINGIELTRDQAKQHINKFFFRNMAFEDRNKSKEYLTIANAITKRWPNITSFLISELKRQRSNGYFKILGRSDRDNYSYTARYFESKFMLDYTKRVMTNQPDACFIWVYDAIYISQEHANAAIEIMNTMNHKKSIVYDSFLYCASFKVSWPIDGTIDEYAEPVYYGKDKSFNMSICED